MVRRKDGEQQQLKVITTIDDTPGKEHIDSTGQVLMFQTNKVLVPPGFEPFAEFMNNRLHRTEQKLEEAAEQNRRLANSLAEVIPKIIDQSVNHANPDIVFGQIPEGKEADVAIVDSMTVAGECLYTGVTQGRLN